MKEPLHLLMVDDEPDMVSLFRQRFRREVRKGTVILHTATSGREALAIMAKLEASSPLVVLSDVNMPEMDGLELLKRIITDYTETKVYMISAYFGETDYAEKVKKAGAHGTVSKPIDFKLLKEMIFAGI